MDKNIKNITLIGDSHSQYIYRGLSELVRLENLDLVSKLIPYSGVSAWNVDYSVLNRSRFEGSTIVLMFGECDIRRHLPRFNNAEEAVAKYVFNSINFFKGLDIAFMKPVPQAIDELTAEFRNNKNQWHSFEKRMHQQEKFYESLNNYNIKIIDTVKAIGTDYIDFEHSDGGHHLNEDKSIELAKYIYKAVD